MIIGRYRIYDFSSFIKGLKRAARGVSSVSIGKNLNDKGDQKVSTAWLITDDLLVLPDYAVSIHPAIPDEAIPQRKYYCHFQGRRGAIEADLVSAVPLKQSDGSFPALLRLKKALPEHALKLKIEGVNIDEQVFLLHHPKGEREIRLSIGNLLDMQDIWLQYDADTEPGSGGGPILSSDGMLIGMHVRWKQQKKYDHPINEGITLAAILKSLHEIPTWDEIALFHNLVNTTAAERSLDINIDTRAEAPTNTSLMRAAVLWSFDPETFPTEDRDKLQSLVVDPKAKRWSLQINERQRLLRSAGSLKELREVRGTEVTEDPGQLVVNRILEGGPYSLDEVEETALPYWLQAVRWFADVAPSLPTPAEVNRGLERRRVRSRLQAVAGPDFRGRADELAKLLDWYQEEGAGPMVITGIGGIGKSALVAQFAAKLPQDSPLLWLDFDRADLAPDDALSVLSLLSEQMSVQFEKFVAPELEESEWERCAQSFGTALAGTLSGTHPPLLVLDGFEVAQHVKQHDEIWKVLALIMKESPALRVIVSGRAPVRGIKLCDRAAHSLHLKGMARPDAKAWLREHNITNEDVLASVLEISDGVPLVLKLAVRLVEAGGMVSELPEKLPRVLIEGFLYHRILDRVIDPVLKPVARDALVLRSVMEKMILDVLCDSIPEGLDAPEVFSRLTQELGLVGSDEGDSRDPSVTIAAGSGVLRLRPEVRSATLKLLEKDDAARVRLIDERAVAWYKRQDLNETANLAELVYHCLRIGDLEGAEKVWSDNCAPLLMYAEDDMPEAAHRERAWLRERTGDNVASSVKLESWEKDATERIRVVISRGLLRAVPEILNERRERSDASPLVLYDAWALWQAKDIEGARASLSAAGEAQGAVARDRAVLGALLAAQAGDRPEADRLLAGIEDEKQWADRQNFALEALAVRAARVRLAVDLKTELDLSKIFREEPPEIDALEKWLKLFMTASDVTLPDLCRRIGNEWEIALESMKIPALKVPTHQSKLESFAKKLQQARQPASIEGSPLALPLKIETTTTDPNGPWKASDLDFYVNAKGLFEGHPGQWVELGLNLTVLGRRRWCFATTSLFLAQAYEQSLQPHELDDTLSLAIVHTLAAFRGQELAFQSPNGENAPSVDHVFNTLIEKLSKYRKVIAPAPPDYRVSLLKEILRQEEGNGLDKKEVGLIIDELESRIPVESAPGLVLNPGSQGSTLISDYLPRHRHARIERANLWPVILYLLGPDPLETLCRRVLGLPKNLN